VTTTKPSQFGYHGALEAGCDGEILGRSAEGAYGVAELFGDRWPKIASDALLGPLPRRRFRWRF
jgi:hypothetical protein